MHALERLTGRQREILELVARGLTNDDIASALEISSATVRTHVTTILAKLEVTNRTEAASLLHRAAPGGAIADILERPMIAVLPFSVINGDARTETFGPGMAYDLSSLFARWCWFPVVSSASTSNARALGGCREIGRGLGARFIVDGAIRIAEPFIVTVRVDDAQTGACIWTGRYVCVPKAFFETQDAICDEIVATVYPMLVARAGSTVRASHAPDLAGWELAHQGMALQAERSEKANHHARVRFTEALMREPDLVLARYGLGLASYDAVLNQWVSIEEGCMALLECANMTLDLAPHAAEGYYLLARHHQARGEVSGARRALTTAVARNPSFATGHALLAQVLQMSGESDAALVSMQHAMRLGPRAFVAGLSVLHFVRAEYTLALASAEECVLTNAGYAFAYVLAVASAYYLGDASRAQRHLAALRATHPGFDPASLLRTFGTDVDAVERLFVALRALEAPAAMALSTSRSA